MPGEGGEKRQGVREAQEVQIKGRCDPLQLAVAADALTWGSTLCSSCSYSCTGVAEGGSRPECEGCVLRSEEVWEQPTGGAGRGQPQREWQAGWGRQHRLWGETDLQKETKI